MTSFGEAASAIFGTAASDFKFQSWSSVGPDKDYEDGPERTLLHQQYPIMNAAEVGDVKHIRAILDYCEDLNVNYLDHLGRNALHMACASHASLEAIKELLRAGVDPNVKDNVGMTPLSLCVLRNPCVKIIKLLFDYGAKLLPRGSPADAGLFLHFVLICKPTEEEKEILRILIQHGALINDPNAPGQRQALHLAAMSNNCEMITTLVEMGADITAMNHRNETPKEVAISYKCKEAQFCLEELEYRNVFERASLSNKNVKGNEYSRKKFSAGSIASTVV